MVLILKEESGGVGYLDSNQEDERYRGDLPPTKNEGIFVA